MISLKQNRLSLLALMMYFTKLVISSDILIVIPTASYSHQQPFLLITKALLERNHSVTIMTCNPEKLEANENLTVVDWSSTYDLWRKSDSFDLQSRKSQWKNVWFFAEPFSTLGTNYQWGLPSTRNFLKRIISKNTTFDLMIMETFVHFSYLGLLDIVGNPPVIQMVTAHSFSFLSWPFGNPENPAYVPVLWTGNTDSMTFWKRLTNTACYLYYYYHFYNMITAEDKVRHKHLDKKYIKRSLREIFMDNSRGSLISSLDSRITGYSRPVLPKIVEVGPLHLVEPKPLEKQLQEWLDGAKNGVIYMSLGSNMKSSSMGEARRKAFLSAFSKFPQYRVLWKWETEDVMEGQPDNVLLKKWMPQQDILAHPNVKLFIMQGGLQSLQEAFHYGKKLICIPMFGDQDLNCNRIAKIKTGVLLEFNDISEESIIEGLTTVLESPIYEENMQYYSFLSKDTPMSPIQKSMWWIEYVLRHKGVEHLHSGAADLSLVQYYLLDVIAFIAFLLMTFILFGYLVVRMILLELKLKFSKTNIKTIKKKKVK